jgi:hypothetical protein
LSEALAGQAATSFSKWLSWAAESGGSSAGEVGIPHRRSLAGNQRHPGGRDHERDRDREGAEPAWNPDDAWCPLAGRASSTSAAESERIVWGRARCAPRVPLLTFGETSAHLQQHRNSTEKRIALETVDLIHRVD